MKTFLKVLIISFLSLSCGERDEFGSPSSSDIKHRPFQSNFKSCGVIEEVSLVSKVDYGNLELTFENVQEHIFKNYCMSCHQTSGVRPYFDNEADTMQFVTPGSPLQSAIYSTILNQEMPPSYNLTMFRPEVVDYLKRWIESLN